VGEEMEDLDDFTLQQYLARALKRLSNPPLWEKWELTAMAWGISFDGYISVKEMSVGLGVYDRALADAWWKLVHHFGRRDAYLKKGDKLKWRVSAVREVLYFIVKIYPYLPTKRDNAMKVALHCMLRIKEEEGR